MHVVQLAVLVCIGALAASAATPDAQTIIRNSVQANQRDFDAAPHFNHKERDHSSNGDKTFLVAMMEGSPYRRLIATNGNPLSASQERTEASKEQQERQRRAKESASQRQARVAKYQKDRSRDHAMMSQLTEAFTFELAGQCKVRDFDVYDLKATPKAGYQPPNLATQVLPGMQGELWIDTKTFQWVKVMAQVVRPVAIEGFLAQVEPGTRFELDKAPISGSSSEATPGSVWLASHFAMQANAKVLFMINHDSQEDDQFWDYRSIR